MSRPLLIGQAPGPNTNPDLPLYPLPKTSAGGRLMAFMGADRQTYMDRFERINLLYKHPGQERKEDKFPKRYARVAAQAMRPLLEGRQIILVGRNVAEAFGYQDVAFHEWATCPRWGLNFVCIPHPSGRNRWYNDENNKIESREFWAAFLELLKESERKVLSLLPN